MRPKILDHSQVLSLLPERVLESHKGDYGRVLLLCGAIGYTGAPALAAMGALRSGAGLVYLGVPDCIYEIEAVKLTEPIVFPLPSENGTFSGSAIHSLVEHLDKMDAVLVGPGIGISQGSAAVVEYVLKNYHGPVVLDADGINVIVAHKDILRERTSPTILTPHPGEFKRIAGQIHNRLDCASSFAKQFNTIVVLKGHKTVITDGTACYINTTGNPGMAVGGCGDVLAGMIVSLLGQGLQPLEAAACAAWLHGASGDLCVKQIGQYGMLPTDMLNVLPRLMK